MKSLFGLPNMSANLFILVSHQFILHRNLATGRYLAKGGFWQWRNLIRSIERSVDTELRVWP